MMLISNVALRVGDPYSFYHRLDDSYRVILAQRNKRVEQRFIHFADSSISQPNTGARCNVCKERVLSYGC